MIRLTYHSRGTINFCNFHMNHNHPKHYVVSLTIASSIVFISRA